jgi:uncharacterized protein (DUF433 family)/DNA-binding transcriptional MerR regulator
MTRTCTVLPMASMREMPPRGHYLANEVGRLAGVSGQKIGQWARRGYIRSSQSDARPRIYSFQDVAEAMIVHELLTLNVRHPEILSAIRNLREAGGSSWPLQNAGPLRVTITDWRMRRSDEPELEVLLPAKPGARYRPPPSYLLSFDGHRYIRPAVDASQGLLDIDTMAVRSDLSRGGWAARSLPALEHIEVDPDRLSGRPTIRGRRIAAEDVARIAITDTGRADLREGFGLSDEEIDDARRWWAEVTEYEAAA